MRFSGLIPLAFTLSVSSVKAQSFCSSAKHSGESVRVTSNKVGQINGIGYELWADSGNNSATFYSDGSFSCSFQNAKDYLCRSGLSFDSTKTHQQLGHMYADFKLVKQGISNVDYSYVGIYGWTRSPLVEFYVVDNWLSQWRPGDWVGNKKYGDYTIDGAKYTVYENSRYGPSIDGDTNFKQFFSIRQQARDCGTIDITAHFEQWEKLGMKMGKMHEAKVLGEAGSTGSGTSGTADFPYAKVYIGKNGGNTGGNTGNTGGNGNSNTGGNSSNASGSYELLKDYANGFRIGVAANTMKFNNQAYNEALKAFNYMVAENGCKLSGIQQQKGVYNFSDCDNHLKKAKELGMDFRGHCLIWHSYQPSWFENADANTLKNAIVDHITKTLQHYEGKIDTWDVVNEAIDDSSNGNGWKMRNSFLYQKVPNFVDLAFQTARKVSPNTKLFYNDYNTEGIYGKSESVYQFVKDMISRNIPIDGVGIQYHVSVSSQPKYEKINDLISRYCKLGIEVHITELDVKCDNQCNSNNVEQQQATVFTNALKACFSNSCCTGYLVWGVGDNDSWLGSDKKGLLFNSNYKPKSQYTAILNFLKENKPSSSGSSTNPSKNNTCSEKILAQGYKCCSDKNCIVYYEDSDGYWGIENDDWCGCGTEAPSCIGVQGYPCCKNTSTVFYTDDDGDWGVENNNWCVIKK
ncbi:hypothetical protein H8356DRAFT_993845 [Neocallimastix lanati (nom. inval.)]|jgi:endo-1,4-beta-xylanase|uniref:Beta-xylanase n=1 Tax=Neocallimastix californiae TaxID=1754190 RepID=A0A1Y2ELU6_9FUNG|nr:hypothetical protein H8356DRAFT_993845 [Neocallimastix sp. JGI-2020a]ORY72274.1 hypothetical protein LY90DRAFT_700014 [Neocallimastix californiae]|eukprot:ORY72274.1 hypothetical protein LY90DRAFT_700014 [Neocallimastix californiae]